MPLSDARNFKQIFHLTALDNMPSIIENGLMSRKNMIANGLIFSDIADPDIIEKRYMRILDKYVPFHFHPYTSFDFAVNYS